MLNLPALFCNSSQRFHKHDADDGGQGPDGDAEGDGNTLLEVGVLQGLVVTVKPSANKKLINLARKILQRITNVAVFR